MITPLRLAAVTLLGLAVAGHASAQSAGTRLVRIGAAQISPQTGDGSLSTPSFANTRVRVESATAPVGGLTYMVTDHISIDLPLSPGFKHDIVGDGAIAGVGRIGEVRALPVTLLAQYRLFSADSPVRPYLGIGPTYAKFYKARTTLALSALTGGTAANPTTMSVDSKFTVSVQAGLTWFVSQSFFVDATVLKTPLRTTTTLSTGQTLSSKLDPTTVALAVGMKF